MKIQSILFLLSLLTVSASAQAKPQSRFVYTANPDKFTEMSSRHYFKETSDTGKMEFDGCYRRIDKGDLVQVVCRGKVQSLFHDGYPVSVGIACRHDFRYNREVGKFLTTREPKCTR